MTSRTPAGRQSLQQDFVRLIEARHHDPFDVLGRRVEGDQALVRVFLPRARKVRLPDQNLVLKRVPNTDIFQGSGPAEQTPSIGCSIKWQADA